MGWQYAGFICQKQTELLRERILQCRPEKICTDKPTYHEMDTNIVTKHYKKNLRQQIELLDLKYVVVEMKVSKGKTNRHKWTEESLKSKLELRKDKGRKNIKREFKRHEGREGRFNMCLK